MKIILLNDVAKVGRKFEVKEVADGFALNSLIPQKKAIFASPSAIKDLEHKKKAQVAEEKVQHDLLMKNVNHLKEARLTIKAKANEKGHLFSGINKEALSKIIKDETKLDIPVSVIQLDKPLKETGDHTVKVLLGETKGEFTVNIEAL